MRKLPGALALLTLALAPAAQAAIPATPVMTVYEFNGPMSVSTYSPDRIGGSPVGSLTQGTSVIPCLVIQGGKPLTDSKGTPYVGFEVVVDPRRASRSDTERFKRAVAERKRLKVDNHHCKGKVREVVNVRELYALEKAPFFDPPAKGRGSPGGGSQLDRIVRAFHASPQCEQANRNLTGRRGALERAWDGFIAANGRLGSKTELARAKHLDYVMRTALYEGHIGRGCSAYGGCERNIVALSLRNRVVGQCLSRQGCRFPGDYQGAASSVTQYNIWDEYLTQISGLTSCFLRPDLASEDYYGKIQAMYEQNVGDVERIMFGNDADLRAVFPKNSLADLTSLRHYYHAPAMGKCFPNHPRVEYMSGAVAGARRRLRPDRQHPHPGGRELRQRLHLQGVPVRRDGQGRQDPDRGQLSRLRGGRAQGLAAQPRELPGLRGARGLPLRLGRALPQGAELAQGRQARGDHLPPRGSGRVLPRRRHHEDRRGGRALRRGDAAGGRGALSQLFPAEQGGGEAKEARRQGGEQGDLGQDIEQPGTVDHHGAGRVHQMGQG